MNLTAMVTHRRQELEEQLRVFVEKCDHAVREIQKMKQHALTLPDQLNCDPSEIRNKYLKCMNQLVEYNYVLGDVKMILDNPDVLEISSTDCMPVQDVQRQTWKPLTPIRSTMNLMDALSEPTPSTSKACSNQCPPDKPVKKKIPKEEQLLIAFSSSSCSSESIPSSNIGKEVQHNVTNDVKKLTLHDSQPSLPTMEEYYLPQQKILQQDCTYRATISYIDGLSFWVVTDIEDAHNLMIEMNKYYEANTLELCLNEMMSLTYCVYCEAGSYFRAFFIRLTEEDMSIAEVFLLDIGETCNVPTSAIMPLVPQFCTKPPFARCCHFAGVDLLGRSTKEVDLFLQDYVGSACQIRIDDKYVLQFEIKEQNGEIKNDSSESLGAYVVLPSGQVLNDILVQRGLAHKITDKTPTENTSVAAIGLPELSESNLDITDCPEYEDPLVAVTGYHNRDEKDICKHYKGGPEKTCFKGSRCTKRHVLMHPEGWTLDQVPALVKCPSLPLPAPGTFLRVTTKHVEHYNSFYVHFSDQITKNEAFPEFGVVLPPTTLNKLIIDMNSPATRMAYKPCKLIPALGELVAALYPLDGNWYRAMVIDCLSSCQNVEVRYIDYGNRVFVKEDAIRELDPRFLALPTQAVHCVLAGVSAKTTDSRKLVAAKEALFNMIQERTLQARVIARSYNQITVELFDGQGFSVAEQLAATMPDVLTLHEYELVDDTAIKRQIVAG